MIDKFHHTQLYTERKVSIWALVGGNVTSLAADMCLTADPGVDSLVPARSHTFLAIDHFVDSRMVVVSYKRKYVQEVLVNCLAKLAQKKVWLG